MTLLRVLIVGLFSLVLLALAVLVIRGPAPAPVNLYGRVDGGVPSIAATTAPASRRQHLVVQFERSPTAFERRGIEAQAIVRFVASVPRNAYIVGFAMGRRDEVNAALSRATPRVIRFIELNKMNRISPAFEPKPRIRRVPDVDITVPEYAAISTRGGAEARIQVRIFSDVPRAEAMQTLQRYGSPTVVTEGLWDLEVTKAQIADLAGEDSVQFISPYPGEPTNDLDQARRIIDVETGVTETGAVVTIAQREGAHPAAHDAFKHRLTITDNGSGTVPPEAIAHATMVAGILAGGLGGDDRYRGIATGVKLRAYSSRFGFNADLQYLDAVSASPPATITNNSWGYEGGDHFHSSPEAYTNLSFFYDVLSSGRDETGDPRGPGGRLLVVGSAGNQGYLTKPWSTARIGNSAKDAIAVGFVANQSASAEPLLPGCKSSRGPTSDGRITPTLVAPGDEIVPQGVRHIRSTSAVPAEYGDDLGTSFSAPMIAGAAAVLTERIHNRCAARPTPTDLRALLVHTAVDLTDANSEAKALVAADVTSKVAAAECGHIDATANYVGPDFTFGWGLSDVRSAIDAATEYVNGTLECGGWIEYRISLDGPSESAAASPLKVTLAWDDPPYPINAMPAADTGVLQNDLDLELVAPDGRRFLPWHLDASNPAAPATRASFSASKAPDDALRDHRNTIEQVVVDAGDRQPGEWRIRVRANQMQLGPQSFTLVSNAFAPTACGQFPPGDIVHGDQPVGTSSNLVPLLVAVLVLIGLIGLLVLLAPQNAIGPVLVFLVWLAALFLLLRFEFYWGVVMLLGIGVIVGAVASTRRQNE